MKHIVRCTYMYKMESEFPFLAHLGLLVPIYTVSDTLASWLLFLFLYNFKHLTFYLKDLYKRKLISSEETNYF